MAAYAPARGQAHGPARAGRPGRDPGRARRASRRSGGTTFARLIALELGKPVKDGLRRDGPRRGHARGLRGRGPARSAASCCRSPAGGGAIGNTALTYRAPAGVALAITPFNAPANLLAHKLGASFAAGNTTIVKAPPQAPAVSAAVVALLLEAGAPVEAVQLLHGGGEVGAALCGLSDVSVVSFTGSAATGRRGRPRGRRQAAGAGARRQRGDHRVRGRRHRPPRPQVCARTGYSNSGQSCISVQRVYVHRSRYRRVRRRAHRRGRGGWSSVIRSTRRPTSGPWWTMPRPSGSSAGRPRRPRAGATDHHRGRPRRRDAAAHGRGRPAAPTPRSWSHEVFGALVAVLPYDDFDDVLEACNAQPVRAAGRAVHPRHRPRSSPPGASSRSAAWSSTARPTSGSTTCRSAGSRTPASAASRRAR